MKTILITLDICSLTQLDVRQHRHSVRTQTQRLKYDIDNEIRHRVIEGSIASVAVGAAAVAVYKIKYIIIFPLAMGIVICDDTFHRAYRPSCLHVYIISASIRLKLTSMSFGTPTLICASVIRFWYIIFIAFALF